MTNSSWALPARDAVFGLRRPHAAGTSAPLSQWKMWAPLRVRRILRIRIRPPLEIALANQFNHFGYLLLPCNLFNS